MEKSAEQLCRLLPTDAESPEVLKPGNRPLDRPATIVASQRSSILRNVLRSATTVVWRDHLNALTAAKLSSLISSCRRHGVNRQVYPTQLLANLAERPVPNVDQWLPDERKKRTAKPLAECTTKHA